MTDRTCPIRESLGSVVAGLLLAAARFERMMLEPREAEGDNGREAALLRMGACMGAGQG